MTEASWQVRAYAPGRTELAGNHVDHQGGTVIAATIDCGCTMFARANGSTLVHVDCDGFSAVEFDLLEPDALQPHEDEKLTTQALIRGCVAQMMALGVPVSGFTARLESTVPPGGGLSSSAAVELACICALDCLFGDGNTSPMARARMGKAAECDFFGKPCGLMDQGAIACGGIVAIDFSDETNPCVERIDCDLSASGWSMLLVDSHAEHSAQNDAFSQIPYDMQHVAHFFGKTRLEDVGAPVFYERFSQVREHVGDRAALRALHYFNEVGLVRERIDALKSSDIARFVELTRRSAVSSAQYLQNISVATDPDQSAMVALAIADVALDGRGSCRIHGGGFGGKIQVIFPSSDTDAFIAQVDAQLGQNSCQPIRIVDEGAHAEWI